MTIPELHKDILAEATRIIGAHDNHTQVLGEAVDLAPGQLILDGVKLNYPDGGPFIKTGKAKSTSTIELTLSTEAARPTFEWLAEITLKEPDNVEHYLLCPDETIIETYGKNVINVGVDRAQALLERLQTL